MSWLTLAVSLNVSKILATLRTAIPFVDTMVGDDDLARLICESRTSLANASFGAGFVEAGRTDRV